MPLKPWYKVVTPREDLREGKPLDASEFAVHLDDVRNGSAPADCQKPDRFFGRTYLTKNLSALASQVMRRLSGERTETSAVFNLATQPRLYGACLSWSLAQTLSAFEPGISDNNHWICGVPSRKKGMEF